MSCRIPKNIMYIESVKWKVFFPSHSCAVTHLVWIKVFTPSFSFNLEVKANCIYILNVFHFSSFCICNLAQVVKWDALYLVSGWSRL